MTAYAQSNLRASPGEDRHRRLRLALKLDAAVSGAFGVLILAAGSMIEDMLGAPLALLWSAGLFTVVYAVFVWTAASGAGVSRPAAWSVVAGNLLWVLGSVVVVAAGWFPLTALGTAFVLAQAAVVALLADLQFFGLRRARPVVS